MFKIVKTDLSSPFLPGSLDGRETGNELLAQYCIAERWTGDLANGVFMLGECTARAHGLDERACGLLNLIRCYETADRNNLLDLFEQAATASSSFCFSTTIHLDGVPRQPVFCIGESTGLEDNYAGSLTGLFAFPRFQLAGPGGPLRRQ